MPATEDSKTPAGRRTQEVTAPCFTLFCCLVCGFVLSFVICAACMRMAVGAVSLPGSSFGISPDNFQLVQIAAAVLGIPTMFATIVGFFILSSQRKWLALVPAVVIPVLGGGGFLVFLLSGLST